jgi:hypothetical protein
MSLCSPSPSVAPVSRPSRRDFDAGGNVAPSRRLAPRLSVPEGCVERAVRDGRVLAQW